MVCGRVLATASDWPQNAGPRSLDHGLAGTHGAATSMPVGRWLLGRPHCSTCDCDDTFRTSGGVEPRTPAGRGIPLPCRAIATADLAPLHPTTAAVVISPPLQAADRTLATSPASIRMHRG